MKPNSPSMAMLLVGWLSDLVKRLSDLQLDQLGDKKVTLNHLVDGD